MNLANMDLHCFCIALRWAKTKNFPVLMADWQPQHDRRIAEIVNELHQRKKIDMVCRVVND